MTVSIGVSFERDSALFDIQQEIGVYGGDIKINLMPEISGPIERDSYGSIIGKTPSKTLSIKAEPITFNPTKQDLKKAGLEQEYDCIIYCATKDLTDNSLVFKDISEERDEVVIDGSTYVIRDKSQYSQFADAYLYFVLGLYKKT